MTLRSILLIPIALGALAGCGLKGPLYLPEEPEQKVSEQTGAWERKERSRDAGTQPPVAPTDTRTATPSEPPPET